ncbi:MAG TPA: type III polyketide synthase [Plantibacter sp.]|uniref:type III polyketide synthase n=1 Tax=unclassified Plantibacter TaxID=2624265 RepID=UPI002B5120DF|nr:type III polyketide synthase [Plantibacter sp.]
MTVSVRSIGTAVPPTILRQDEIRDVFRDQPDRSRLAQRLIGAAFDGSAIETRHTVIDEFDGVDTSLAAVYYDADRRLVLAPPTGARNDTYIEHAPPLLLEAARRALDAAPGITAADVTHVVTASCTGFFAPGPEYVLVRDLGLPATTERYHLGFQGCFAAFPALRAAQAFCDARPDAVVLVVCVELCSIHLRSSDDPDVILASSVFADGAAAAVVSARPGDPAAPVLEFDGWSTALVPDGESDMAWTIGDHGFEMVLSAAVPKLIGEHLESALEPLLATVDGDVSLDAIDRWAVHPGGRSILDKVQQRLGLSDDLLEPSRAVLREQGNMSSATVLFILQRLLEGASPGTDERICALAFGPGLTIESALLRLSGGR